MLDNCSYILLQSFVNVNDICIYHYYVYQMILLIIIIISLFIIYIIVNVIIYISLIK